MGWHHSFKRLHDSKELRGTRDYFAREYSHVRRCVRRASKPLEKFFSDNEKVDIAFVLYGGLRESYHLADHLDGHNFLAYRPVATQRKSELFPFLVGTPNPSRPLLIFDEEVFEGRALRETAAFFESKGYARDMINCFIPHGYLDEVPLLGPVDEILTGVPKEHGNVE